jgi:hypothetical protein
MNEPKLPQEATSPSAPSGNASLLHRQLPYRAMSIPCKFERSILSHDEHEVILRSHHPEIYDSGLDDLKALRQRLRDMHGKERTPGAREPP